MIFHHYLMCLIQALYTMYNVTSWHIMMAGDWIKANWKYRERFIKNYRPSTDKERELEMSYKNAAGLFRYQLKRNMLVPREPADENDPVWGKTNKKYNVDNHNKP